MVQISQGRVEGNVRGTGDLEGVPLGMRTRGESGDWAEEGAAGKRNEGDEAVA